MDENQKMITAPKEAMEEEADQENNIPVSQIHEFWLNNELSKHMEPHLAHQQEPEILLILNTKTDIECENKLVSLLNYDKFALIKKLLVNRKKIYYCTKLHQAKAQSEKEALVDEIREDNCEFILDSLDQVKLKINAHNQNIKNIKKQAAELNKQQSTEQEHDYVQQFTDDDFS